MKENRATGNRERLAAGNIIASQTISSPVASTIGGLCSKLTDQWLELAMMMMIHSTLCSLAANVTMPM